MGTTNKYEDMSTLEALKYANNHLLVLPDIQREYVWEAEAIEKLFESIVDDYPVGTCIFWKSTRANINKEKPNLYYFLREYKKKESKNEPAPEVLSEEGPYYIVLDGQQRITSLNIALYGSYTSFKGGRGNSKANPDSWIRRELYYNLDFYDNEEIDDEKPRKRFSFLSDEEKKQGNWYKIKEILKFKSDDDLIADLVEKGYHKLVRKDLKTLFQRIEAGSGNGLIHYYCIDEEDYDKALDVFIRVNSTGQKLAKTDLFFSTLVDGWDDGKKKIEDLLKTMNSKGDGFDFSKDYLMRLALVLVDANTNMKIQSFTPKIVHEIRNNWDKIKETADKMTTLLANIGLSNETLTSYNATMPVAYYIYKGGKKIKDSAAQNEVRKFLSVAMAKRLFGVASNAALDSTRKAIKKIDCSKIDFNLSIFKDVELVGGRTFIVSKEDIEYCLNNYEKGKNAYILLSLLYPDYKLSQVTFHQDHCHPYVGFEEKNIKNLNLPAEVVEDWRSKRNLIPNLQFLKDDENEHKNQTPLIEWIAENNTIEYMPENVSLEFKDFDVFFEKRRILIKKKLFDLFGLDYNEEDSKRDHERVENAEKIRKSID